jgi:hypothetical protein
MLLVPKHGGAWQRPLPQNFVSPVQVVPQLPQLVGSLFKSTHA